MLIDEIDFVLATGRELGLDWQTVGDVGSSLLRSIGNYILDETGAKCWIRTDRPALFLSSLRMT